MLTGPSDAADLDTLIQKSSALTDAVTGNDLRIGASGGRVTLTLTALKAPTRWNTSRIGDLTPSTPATAVRISR